jgi:hypothetical protein
MRSIRRSLMCLLCACLLGCGGNRPTAIVSGSITFDGADVESGAITFTPEEGGSTSGAEIRGGRYIANNVAVGKNRVHITSRGSAGAPGSGGGYAQMSDMYREAYRRGAAGQGAAKKLVEKAPAVVPPNAVGNDQTVEIEPGKQTRNFDLRKPAARR